MECLRCGSCCRYFMLPWDRLHNLMDDERKWLALHGMPSEEGLIILSQCRALTRAKGEPASCLIHPGRPQMCRDAEPGGRDCRESRARYGLPALEAVTGSMDEPTQ